MNEGKPTQVSELVVTGHPEIHASSAAVFVKAAKRFDSAISVQTDGSTIGTIDGKSIVEVLMLNAARGSRLKLTATGPDASQAARSLDRPFRRLFTQD